MSLRAHEIRHRVELGWPAAAQGNICPYSGQPDDNRSANASAGIANDSHEVLRGIGKKSIDATHSYTVSRASVLCLQEGSPIIGYLGWKDKQKVMLSSCWAKNSTDIEE
jgi:hypothetical protein